MTSLSQLQPSFSRDRTEQNVTSRLQGQAIPCRDRRRGTVLRVACSCSFPPLTDFQDSVTGLLLAGIGVSFSGRRGRRLYLTFR